MAIWSNVLPRIRLKLWIQLNRELYVSNVQFCWNYILIFFANLKVHQNAIVPKCTCQRLHISCLCWRLSRAPVRSSRAANGANAISERLRAISSRNADVFASGYPKSSSWAVSDTISSRWTSPNWRHRTPSLPTKSPTGNHAPRAKACKGQNRQAPAFVAQNAPCFHPSHADEGPKQVVKRANNTAVGGR